MPIKKLVQKINNFHFYFKPQNYFVDYQVLIKNKINELNSVYLVLPIPINTDYQELKGNVEFDFKPNKIDKDKIYKNKYAAWEVRLEPNAVFKVQEKFNILVNPRKYKLSEKFYLSDYNKDYSRFLKSNKFINPKNEKIEQVVKQVIGQESDVFKILKLLNSYVISNLIYGNPIQGLYTAKEAIDKKNVDCGGFDSLLASLCISAGIPARIVSGFWAGYENNDMHAWLEVLLPNGDWVLADPSVEYFRQKGKTKKSGKLGFAGSDRIALSVGCDIPIEINQKEYSLDILQNPYVISEHGSYSVKLEREFITKKE